MAASRSGHIYTNIRSSDTSRNHLGDVYNQYGPSPDQKAFQAVLDSLRYDGMDDRRDRLNSAERGTFEWALAGRNIEDVGDCDDASDDDDDDVERDVESDSMHFDNGSERGSGSNDGGEYTDNEDDPELTDGEDDEDNLWHSTKIVDEAFTDWLISEEEGGSLFCFMGKPGSGKSTLMYDFPK
jgi:hypothetical protein